MNQSVITRINTPKDLPLEHSDQVAPESKSIRLIYMGRIPGWQTQAVYHTVAEMMTEETPDTIIISQPADAYVCLGYHQQLNHVFNREACEKRNIPILRRKIGGGGTYLDSDQLFYQCVFHSSRIPAQSTKVYEQMLSPVVNTLNRFLDDKVNLVGSHEIEVNGKRIAGIGGGQIGEASVVVGNILFDFDFESMAAVWNVPNELYRQLGREAMADHIITLDEFDSELAMDRIADGLIEEYENYFKRHLNPGGMNMEEIERAGQMGAFLKSESFLNSAEDTKLAPPPLKISRDVFIHHEEYKLENELIAGSYRVESGKIHSLNFEPSQPEIEAALQGIWFKDRENQLNIANYKI